MEEVQCDLAVIGSGPAGQKAAIQAAKLGGKVVIIEKDPEPGGACLYSGTIPSKSLREAILDLTGFYEYSYYGQGVAPKEVSINALNFRLSQVIAQEKSMISRQFKKNGIRYLQGSARFENANMLIVVDDDYTLCYQVTAKRVLIATGSKPRNPIQVPFDDEVILDSTRLLAIDTLPRTMIVLGGGIIGSEYASFFAALGTEVTIIDKKDRILPLVDEEIGRHLLTSLTAIGVRFVGRKEPEAISRVGNRAVVKFKDGEQMEADVLLFALGRVANVDNLHIENAGLAINSQGFIPVNALFQTTQSHIYAVGDVIGGPALASTSMEQGRLAARHAFSVETHQFPAVYPLGIYTIPEISICGYTETQLQELGFHYEVGRAYYYEIARSHIAGNNAGVVKILFHAETLEILGVHIIGKNATELIHIGQVAMSHNSRVDFFIEQVFNYPTYAEGYRVAALNGFNKVKHRR